MNLISANFCSDFLSEDPIGINPESSGVQKGLKAIRAGACGSCKSVGTVKSADVTKFTLVGANISAHYAPEAWEGFECSNCGNQIAITRW